MKQFRDVSKKGKSYYSHICRVKNPQVVDFVNEKASLKQIP